MFYATLSIRNPWFLKGTPQDNYKTIIQKHGRISDNKHWELELIKDKQLLARVELSLSWRGRDHAGLEMGIALLGLDLAFRVYDVRHWDYENNRWLDKTT